MSFAKGTHRLDERDEVFAFICEFVGRAWWAVLVQVTRDHVIFFEMLELGRERARADALKGGCKVAKAARSHREISNDEKRPHITDQFGDRSDRAGFPVLNVVLHKICWSIDEMLYKVK